MRKVVIFLKTKSAWEGGLGDKVPRSKSCMLTVLSCSSTYRFKLFLLIFLFDKVKVKRLVIYKLYSGTVSFTETGGYRLFCSALPVRSCYSFAIPRSWQQAELIGPSHSAHAMPWLLARHSTAPTRDYYSVIQRVQCWWATTCNCRDEDSNPGPPDSEKSVLPLGHCPSQSESS